jgi:Ankyrin repeats (3 copies)
MVQKILFFLLFFNITVHAMDLTLDKLSDDVLTIDKLHHDIRLYLIDSIAIDIFPNKPRTAARTIKALSHTCKQFNIDINDPHESNRLVKIIAKKYYCSHESISKFLHTRQAKKQYLVQCELKKLCCSTRDNNLLAELDTLISKGVDLEFTYNHDYYQKTPLMIASNNYNNNMFEYLLKRKANINGCNSYGMTMLHLATHRPKRSFIKLIQQPGIVFNQQDEHHKTALLYCIMRRKDPADAHFITMIIKFLEANTDPEATNTNGLSPLVAAEQLKDNDEKELVIQLIRDAITRKQATAAINL